MIRSLQHITSPTDHSLNEATHTSRRRAVLLINLGTPDEPTVPAVRRYLAEFLADPEVIRMPTGLGWLNRPLARTIARFRAPRSAHMYQTIWTDQGSPLRTITQQQVDALKDALPKTWAVYYAMRYGLPAIGDTVARIAADGIEELVVVPMYPQFSGPTTRTALTALYKHLEHHDQTIQVTTRPVWHNDGGYVNAQALRLEQFARDNSLSPDNAFLLYTAHGLPVSYVRRGDPYPGLVKETVDLVSERLGWPADRYAMAYQSRFGPTEWLQPYTDECLRNLGASGERNVLVCPVTFTADCLETNEELGVRYRREFEKSGGVFHLCPALNTFEPFIEALRDLVLRGPKPVNSWRGNVRPLLRPNRKPALPTAGIENLVMVGACSPGCIGAGDGPDLRFTETAQLRQVKRPQCAVPDFLRSLYEQVNVREVWLWNTCKRFELYAVVDNPDETDGRAQIVDQMRRNLFGDDEPAGLHVNILFGADAYHHLLRTAAGMNSGLPGERDVVEQLQAAHRLAEAAGTLGPFAAQLLEDTVAFERRLEADSHWGRYCPAYTHTAIASTVPVDKIDWPNCRAVVIGGSTTSAGILRTLIEQFNVPSRQITLIYRGHKKGGQIKMLRKAIGGGRRLRVQDYGEPPVIQAIADADVVFFGIDREEPVLRGRQLHDLRDFARRPLYVVDFNVFGSTKALEGIAGVALFDADMLDAGVEAFAEHTVNDPEFRDALAEAEQALARRVEHMCKRDRLSEPRASARAEDPHEQRVVLSNHPRSAVREESDVS